MPAPKGNNFNPEGRSKEFIDWKQFEDMCEIQCTQEEIANVLRINRDTLRDRAVEYYGEEFSAIYKKYSAGGKCSLRRYQYKMSKKNPTMAIWLGKNWLDQKDNKEEVQLPEEATKSFVALMGQLSALQASKESDSPKSSSI